MPCAGSGRCSLLIVILAALVGAALLGRDAAQEGTGMAGTLALGAAWFAALVAVFSAPTCGCRARAKIARLLSRRSGSPNPYRDIDRG